MSAPFGPAWAAEDPAALELLPPPGDAFAWRKLVRAAARPLEAGVRRALADRNAGRDDPTVSKQLSALDGPVACVVTGQQLGLFGGPIYTLVKALAAIAWARRLEAVSGVRVLPVFWLQSEDHDFDEVAGWTGPAHAAPLSVRLAEPAGEHRCSLGARTLGPDVEAAVDRVEQACAGGLDGADVYAELRAAYRPGASWTDAFVRLVSSWLRGRGLLFFDPRHPEAARAAAPIWSAALERAPELTAALRARADALEAAGFRVQVPVRDEGLVFVHPDGPGGPRYRPTPDGDGWTVPGVSGRFERATIRAWLEGGEGRFSSSALLRPLLQDSLLPPAGLVGGPGEVAYLAQCVSLRSALGIPAGLVLARPRVRLVEPWARRTLARWSLEASDVGATVDATLARMPPLPGPDGGDVRRRLAGALATIDDEAKALGADLDRPRRALGRQVERAFGRYAAKYERIRQRRDADRLAAAERLTRAWWPMSAPQERVFGIIPFLARYGTEYVVRRMSESIEDAPDGSLRSVNL